MLSDFCCGKYDRRLAKVQVRLSVLSGRLINYC
jgi:hypothetical protein